MKYLLALLALSLSGCADARPAPVEQYTYRIILPSGALCSATAVAKDVILTAKHCVEGDEKTLTIAGQTVPIGQMAEDGLDHVLIQVGVTFKTWASRGPTPKPGDAVRIYGNADGYEQIYRTGYVMGWAGYQLLMDMNCGLGDSGAGIFNDAGQLVGVVSAVHVGRAYNKFCIAYQLGVLG